MAVLMSMGWSFGTVWGVSLYRTGNHQHGRRSPWRGWPAMVSFMMITAVAGGSASQATAQVVEPEPETPSMTASAPAGSLAGLVAQQHLLGGGPVDVQRQCMALFDDSTLIGQTLMPGIAWDNTASILDELAAGTIGGWVVMGTPDATLATRVSEARAAAVIEPLVAVDEEGGRVQRLRNVLNRLPSAAAQAAENTPEELRALIQAHSRDMVALGFDIDFAPVVDVGGGPGIGDRAFSDDVDEVILYAEAVRLGLADGGLLGVVKHFPGHGRASADSHVELPTSPPIEELQAIDLEPFRVAIAAGAEAIMVAHLDVTGLTAGMPASLSRDAVTGLLRDELGFDGLVLTDALDMGAVVQQWSTPQAVELALIAGNDIALLGNADEIDDIHAGVADALAQGRVDRARLVDAASMVFDAKGLFGCRVVLDQKLLPLQDELADELVVDGG